MDPTLQRLLDEHEITRLCYRYGTTLDDRDWAGLRTCFTDDAVTVYEGPVGGEFTGYEAIEQDGDTATAQCYLHAQHVRPGTPGGDLCMLGGRYTDRITRTPDGWRFTHRRLETWWIDGNPAVLGG
jgi:hypothetical protein